MAGAPLCPHPDGQTSQTTYPLTCLHYAFLPGRLFPNCLPPTPTPMPVPSCHYACLISSIIVIMPCLSALFSLTCSFGGGIWALLQMESGLIGLAWACSARLHSHKHAGMTGSGAWQATRLLLQRARAMPHGSCSSAIGTGSFSCWFNSGGVLVRWWFCASAKLLLPAPLSFSALTSCLLLIYSWLIHWLWMVPILLPTWWTDILSPHSRSHYIYIVQCCILYLKSLNFVGLGFWERT